MLGWQNFMKLRFDLPTTEFPYNSSVNMSIGISPFEVVHDYKPKKPMDLTPMTQHPRVSKFASAFTSHVYDCKKNQ